MSGTHGALFGPDRIRAQNTAAAAATRVTADAAALARPQRIQHAYEEIMQAWKMITKALQHEVEGRPNAQRMINHANTRIRYAESTLNFYEAPMPPRFDYAKYGPVQGTQLNTTL